MSAPYAGPAFPVIFEHSDATSEHFGMDLRDYFAAKAWPQAWASELADLRHFNDDVTDRHVSEAQVARRAYAMADAMLRARATSPTQSAPEAKP